MTQRSNGGEADSRSEPVARLTVERCGDHGSNGSPYARLIQSGFMAIQYYHCAHKHQAGILCRFLLVPVHAVPGPGRVMAGGGRNAELIKVLTLAV